MFFFCKQKTAYEMRISDWSSDVCSSDRAALHAVEVEVRLVVDAPELIGDERAVDVGMERRVGVHVHDRRHGAVVGDEVARLDTQHAFLELPIAPHLHVVAQPAVTALPVSLLRPVTPLTQAAPPTPRAPHTLPPT